MWAAAGEACQLTGVVVYREIDWSRQGCRSRNLGLEPELELRPELELDLGPKSSCAGRPGFRWVGTKARRN